MFLFFFSLYNKNKTIWSLKREIDEIQCQDTKYQSLYDMLNELIEQVGDGEPPQALNLLDSSPTETVSSFKLLEFL